MNAKRKEVIERLITAIHDGSIVLEEDKILPEREIAKAFDENRTVVRESLIALEAMGVVEIRERQGIFLSTSEENEAKKLLTTFGEWPMDALSRSLEMRQILEPTMSALAAARRSEEDIDKLDNCLANMKNVLDGDDAEATRAGIYWNTIFHAIIVSATNNTYMARIYEGIMNSIEQGMYLMRYGTPPTELGGRKVAYEDHVKLFEAIRNKDTNEAERMSEKHLSHTVKAMVALGHIVAVSDLYAHKLVGRLRFE